MQSGQRLLRICGVPSCLDLSQNPFYLRQDPVDVLPLNDQRQYQADDGCKRCSNSTYLLTTKPRYGTVRAFKNVSLSPLLSLPEYVRSQGLSTLITVVTGWCNNQPMNTSVPTKESLAIAGPAGRIEALLEASGNSPATRVGVVCHPHPLHQGTMINKVVHTIARAMNDLGVPAVRFNFRGVGASEGKYADGIGETDDTLAVVRWATERYPAARIWLAGFSFGALVSYRAALETATEQLISVALPVIQLKNLISEQSICQWLIIQGAVDDVVSCDKVIAWVNQLQPGLELIVFPGASHFFMPNLSSCERHW